MRVWIPAALVCALFVLPPAVAETVERNYHETFEVAPGARLDLRHGDGDVEVEPWERDVVEITVRYRAEMGGVGVSSRRDFRVEFRQSGDTIRVTGTEPSVSGIGFFRHRQVEYRYRIQAPAWLELRLDGEDGDVEISGWRGPIESRLDDGDLSLVDVKTTRVEVELADGDLEIDGLEAELLIDADDGTVEIDNARSDSARIRIADGDVLLRRCEGSFEIRGDDGEVVGRELRAASLDVRTEDGDVQLELLAGPRLEVAIGTGDGDVDLQLAAGTSAEVDVRTEDGRIRLDVDAEGLSRSRRRVTGRLGTGEGRLRVTTGDGHVTLRQAS